ncbi:hypothetical protein Tsubulata_006614 [Turnera subulata]|uniref:Protein CYCLOPS n=1 Tax=Turnera subulata TaxID=218843 RepID=A0A9Q0FEP7_9ROSI|nr:hypothetical protein Tsubulata_006614 [Turnera subulata]
MVNGGNKTENAFLKPETSQQQHRFSFYQRPEGDRSVMETDLYRNSSEELFLKSLMDSSMGMPIPTMETLGFKNLSSNFRTDSEELFKSWLTNGEASNLNHLPFCNHGYNSATVAHRTRQASRRMSTELVNLANQQHGGIPQKKRSNDVLLTPSNPAADDISTDPNQQVLRNAVERSMQASNLYLAKAWFHSSQPMTRSRSSELRKRYAAMQNSRTAIGTEAMQNASGNGIINLKQEFGNQNGLSNSPVHETSNQFGSFMSPSNSSSSTFNTPHIGNVDKVTSVVNMLKGTLERRKLNQNEKENFEDNTSPFYHALDVLANHNFDQNGQGNGNNEIPATYQAISPSQVADSGVLQTAQEPVELELENFVNPMNAFQLSAVSREPSLSESSAAAPVMSSGVDACDGPSNSGQALSICESTRKNIGNNRSTENGSRAKEFRERIIDNLKDDRKRGGLVRYGSVTSAGSVDKGDPTKKRRVERSRKMAEAKERNFTPAIPSDMQSVLKRCENLEKEVRSLKLNLSFMNRKDSEQTKQIEELQKQNEELVDEKERLLEEIERLLSETGKL